MAETSLLCCTRCGCENRPQRLFCERCGLGLRVLAPAGAPQDEALHLDAPVATLLLHGLAGALAGLVLSGASLIGLLRVLERSPDLIGSARILSLYYWRVVPLIVALAASVTVVRAGRRGGLGGSYLRGALGAALTVALGFAVSAWAGPAALAGACLISPLGAARAGLGLFRPWWPLRRVLLAGLTVAGASLGLAELRGTTGGAAFLDQGPEGVALLRAGTVLMFPGLQPPILLAQVPEGAVGLAWREGGGLVLLADGRALAVPSGEARQPGPLPAATWTRMLRLGDRLLLIGSAGVYLGPWPQDSGPWQMLWSSPERQALTAKLGALASCAHVRLEGGGLLEIGKDGSVRELQAEVPAMARVATVERNGRRVCAAAGRRVLCSVPGSGVWEESSAGLQVSEILDLCALGAGLAVSTDRGVYLGSGTAAEPFERRHAGRFESLEASERGALAAGLGGVLILDGAGGVTSVAARND